MLNGAASHCLSHSIDFVTVVIWCSVWQPDLGACEAGVSLPLCCTKLELNCVICFCSACYQQRLASRPIAQQLWLGPDSVRKHTIVGNSFADVLQTLHRYTCSRYVILKELYKTNRQVAVWCRASSHAPEKQA